jgi:hypothetical protein
VGAGKKGVNEKWYFHKVKEINVNEAAKES